MEGFTFEELQDAIIRIIPALPNDFRDAVEHIDFEHPENMTPEQAETFETLLHGARNLLLSEQRDALEDSDNSKN